MSHTDPPTGPALRRPDPGLLDAIQSALPNPLVVLDERGRVLLWNPAAEQLFGVLASTAIGQALGALALPEAARWVPTVAEAEESAALRRSGALEITDRSGAARCVEFSATPLSLSGGGAVGTLVVADDVTEVHGQAVRRDRFFSAMSHDLRTPITAVLGYSELLLDGIAGEMVPAQREMVERIFQVAGHLSQLLNDTLDLARLDAGRMEFHREPVGLRRLVDDAVVTVEPQAQAKGIELRMEVESNELLHTDAMRVQQILVNLLANAVKFTPEGEALVRAGCDEESAWVTVSDTGPGLPEGSEEAVFEEFTQMASGRGAKKEPGSGLGLTISRRLARALGGDLTARSNPGAGASFTLRLPRQGR
jgi:PAS domain S-box-containing protein